MRWCHICSQATMVCARGILAVVSTKLVRWGAAAPSDRGSARDRLLDAAERCLESCGVVGTTMEDIGRTAGVSRATVYRYFPNREAVMSGVIIRAAERYLDRINPRIAEHTDLGSALVDFVEYTVEAARREEIIGLLFGSDEELAGVGLAAGQIDVTLRTRHRVSPSHLQETLELRRTGRLRRRRRRVGSPHDTEPADCSRTAGAQS